MDIVLLIGQSNAKGCGNPEESEKLFVPAYEYVENISGNACIPLGITLQMSEGRGTIAPAFANRYYQMTERTVCFVHCAVDGSRIKNWMHDQNHYLAAAAEKCRHCIEHLEKKEQAGRVMAVWIQGESDAKYGTDPIYYKEQLIKIAQNLKESVKIDQMFVSRVGYWGPEKENFKRCRWIGAAQERACADCSCLTMVSKSAFSYYRKGLLQDEVHYCMHALNALGSEIAENIVLYYNEGQKIILKDSENLTSARAYVEKLELLEELE